MNGMIKVQVHIENAEKQPEIFLNFPVMPQIGDAIESEGKKAKIKEIWFRAESGGNCSVHLVIQTWAKCIGGFVLNFGAIECLTFQWIRELDGKKAELAARKLSLSQRINEIIRLLSVSSIAPAGRKKSFKLWKEIKKLSVIRNRIVHNPIDFGRVKATGEYVLTIHDLQKVGASAGNEYKVLSAEKIKAVAIRVAEIANELELIIPTTRQVSK